MNCKKTKHKKFKRLRDSDITDAILTVLSQLTDPEANLSSEARNSLRHGVKGKRSIKVFAVVVQIFTMTKSNGRTHEPGETVVSHTVVKNKQNGLP
jgi:hypothetical protein